MPALDLTSKIPAALSDHCCKVGSSANHFLTPKIKTNLGAAFSIHGKYVRCTTRWRGVFTFQIVPSFLPRLCAHRPSPHPPDPSSQSFNQCKAALITFLCLEEAIFHPLSFIYRVRCARVRHTSTLCARYKNNNNNNNNLYCNAPIAFPVWRHIPSATGTTWQTSQQ